METKPGCCDMNFARSRIRARTSSWWFGSTAMQVIWVTRFASLRMSVMAALLGWPGETAGRGPLFQNGTLKAPQAFNGNAQNGVHMSFHSRLPVDAHSQVLS